MRLSRSRRTSWVSRSPAPSKWYSSTWCGSTPKGEVHQSVDRKVVGDTIEQIPASRLASTQTIAGSLLASVNRWFPAASISTASMV